MSKFVTEIVIIKKFRYALKNYLLNHNFYDVDSLNIAKHVTLPVITSIELT
jgi:hypothetical protein